MGRTISGAPSYLEERERVMKRTSLGRRSKRYRNIVPLAYVLWECQYRFLSDPSLEELVASLEGEIQKMEDRGWISFGAANPRPDSRTLRRLLEDISEGAFEITSQIDKSIRKFRRFYDRQAIRRLQLVEVDCTEIDKDCLALKGIDFVCDDEDKTKVFHAWAMNAFDRVSKASPGTRLYPSKPDYYDTLSFIRDMMLGLIAPELGYCGLILELRLDNGSENAPLELRPVGRRIGCQITYSRAYRPHDKPGIERFQATIWSHVKFLPEDILESVIGGRSLRYVTFSTLRKAYEVARRKYQDSKPQRPRRAATPKERWQATADPAAHWKLDPVTIQSHLYIEHVVGVVGQAAIVRGVEYTHSDFEPHERVRARIFPDRFIHFSGLDGSLIVTVEEDAAI
jgi:hypothetical protein